MKYHGFVLCRLQDDGIRSIVAPFYTLDGAKTARDLYAKSDSRSCYSVIPAVMTKDYMHGRPTIGAA